MNSQFHVRVLDFTILREIDGSRTGADFRALLDAMEFGDTSGLGADELREMCLMSLQDRRPEEAAALVLKHDLGDRLKDGQIRNLAGDMLDEKLWEQHADMSMHERMFTAGSLLYDAFPHVFPEPDAVRVTLEVVASNEPAKQALARALDESLLVRLLADGMDERSVLHRMFGSELSGRSFPQAESIVWIVDIQPAGADRIRLEVVGSGYWLDSLRDTRSYASTAYSDRDRA